MSEHHAQQNGVWIKIAKKTSGIVSVTHDEALDVALCYGWIDGQRKSYDSMFFLQKFTPRRPRSLWSKRNVAKVAKLTATGRMKPSGLAEVEAAKRDGRWEAAYDSSKNIVMPADFLKALEKNKRAQAFFNTLSRSNLYAIALRLTTARKPETRQRRLDALLAMLKRGEFR
jgi:uncharacterized protein YdeI (YjbR/CyaY-like superfamily)